MAKSNCLICTKRKVCPNYQFGGLLIDSNCDEYKEEKELTEEEQDLLDKQFKQGAIKEPLSRKFMNAFRKRRG